MNIRFNPVIIKQILSHFSNITGINIRLLNRNRKTIALYEYNTPDFCNRIKVYPEGRQKCIISDASLMEKCLHEKKFVSQICHAGLTDSVMPIFKENILVGFIIFGRVRTSDSIEDISGAIAWMNESPQTLAESYMKLPYLTKDQLNSVGQLISSALVNGGIILEFSEALTRVTQYIEHNLNKSLTISDLCKVSHVSKNTLYKLFREELETTVNKYIINKRMEYARLLLSTTDKKIYEVSDSVGFCDVAQFSRFFKKHSGLAPVKYKKLYKQTF